MELQAQEDIKLGANLDYGRFMVNGKKYVEIYVSIDGSTTNYVENEEGRYQARIHTVISLINGQDTLAHDQFNIRSPAFDSSRNFLNFSFQRRYFPKTDSFELHLALNDVNTPAEAIEVNLPIVFDFSKNLPAFSDIQFLESYSKSDSPTAYSKNGYELSPMITSFFRPFQHRLKYYFELYNATNTLDSLEGFVFYTYIRKAKSREIISKYSRYQKAKAQPVNAQLGEFSIKDLPSGNYVFTVEMRDKENQLITGQSRYFQRINPTAELTSDVNLEETFASNLPLNKIQHYVASFRPLATDQQQNTIAMIEETEDTTMARNFLYNFIAQKNPYNPEYYWKTLKESIDYVDEEYGNKFRRGYQCQLGRVYLQYGKPNRIETEFDDPQRNAGSTSYPYQIWYYYRIGNQGNRVFVFVNRSIGDNCYDLIHSNVIGEINIPSWNNHRNWKELLQKYSSANQQINYSPTDVFTR